MALAKPRLIVAYLLTLMLFVCMGVFTAYASEGETDPPIYEDIAKISAVSSSMIVNATWLDGEMIRIDVVDTTTGTVSSLAVRLSDFVTMADAQNSRYIMIQAVDLDGNLSGIVQISNPFYVPYVPMPPNEVNDQYNDDENDGYTDDADVSEVPQPGLTPDGTGTVVDNVVTQNEIEFFTVYTEDGNVFFLVVDRQSNTDNVYLLNAVTEADLMALAEQSSNPINNSISAVPAPPPLESPAEEQQPPPSQPQPEPDADEEVPPARSGNNNLIFIAIAVVAVGGAAYYFKIFKGKKSSAASDDDWSYEDDEDDYLDDDVLNEGGGDE